MTTSSDRAAVAKFFAHADRRVATLSAAEGAAAGLVVASAFLLVASPVGAGAKSAIVAAVLAALGGAAGAAAARIRRDRLAGAVERRAPECRNLLFTAHELIAGEAPGDDSIGRAPILRGDAPRYVHALVMREAARLAGTLRVADLFPSRRALGSLGLAALLWGLALARFTAASRELAGTANALDLISRVDVTVMPPAYAGRPSRSWRDPARVEVLAGSRLHLTVQGSAMGVTIETLGGRRPLVAAGDRAFAGELVADADGFIAIEPMARDGHAGARRLVGLSVVADRLPRVRVTAPGKDLRLTDGHRTLDLAIEADDDIGLGGLSLRYTRVSGSGERFTFSEGDVPLVVERTSALAWRAHASWQLDPLKLDPGDLVVYRAVASDRRPGAPVSESDAYIAEVLAPGGEAAEGFALDTDEQRYALSQQMVILKTERLLARKGAVPSEVFTDSAASIAMEQRRVRAEFVFMMGGEMRDGAVDEANLTDLNEEEEAAVEGDILAGRQANQGYRALLLAIRRMSLASRSLNTADVAPALVHEKAAMLQLERAFSHSRIILRALTRAEVLDFSRRLTGPVTDASRAALPNAEPEHDARLVALRGVLAAVAAVRSAAEASALAERALRLDPSSAPIQEVSRTLSGAARALERSRGEEARSLLDSATLGLASALRTGLATAPAAAPGESAILRGALTDELRRLPPGRP